MQADKAWFESHEDIDEFVTFLADDAIFMPDGAPAARGDSIRTTWEQLLSMPGFGLEWMATSARVAEAGDIGYTIGTYELTLEQDGDLHLGIDHLRGGSVDADPAMPAAPGGESDYPLSAGETARVERRIDFSVKYACCSISSKTFLTLQALG